jgi:hypothetical protein
MKFCQAKLSKKGRCCTPLYQMGKPGTTRGTSPDSVGAGRSGS